MYSSNLREVVLIPNRHWGGEGLLGCVFGYVISLAFSFQMLTSRPRFGLLHRIPPQPEDRVPGTMPPELLEDNEHETQDLFVPADASVMQIDV